MTDDTKRALDIIKPMADELNIKVDADDRLLYCNGQAKQLPRHGFNQTRYTTENQCLERRTGSRMKKLTPVKAIRAKCIDCTNGQNNEIRDCQIVKCPLWPYRMGHRPKNTNENSPILENNVVNGEYIEK